MQRKWAETWLLQKASLTKKAEAAAKEAAEMKAKEAENPPVEKPKPVAVVPKPTATKKKEPKPAAQEEGADGEEQFRGYKILPDGRKTSFFHHEMTDEERVCIRRCHLQSANWLYLGFDWIPRRWKLEAKAAFCRRGCCLSKAAAGQQGCKLGVGR